MRTLTAVLACLWILSNTASAQVLGRTRVPPTRFAPPSIERPVESPRTVQPMTSLDVPAPGGDLFLARPGTYAPRYDRPSNLYPGLHWYPHTHGYVSEVYVPFVAPSFTRYQPTSFAPQPEQTSATDIGERRDFVERRDFTATETRPRLPLPPITPAVPRTFYVIPHCYAGDIPPAADQLPAGCDVTNLRTVPPRTLRQES